ncbi:MAG: twin-arginine translocation signal domain-containing protein [Deltaproteobacteria bacterium]|nr:twin-arginine translocation signal domain-containing protein [Deltaproteobacteria bacterium]
MKARDVISRRAFVRGASLAAAAGGLSLLPCPAHAQAELVVVVNAQADTGPLNEAQLASIFTGGDKAWKNGKPIKVFNLAAQTPERAQFDKVVLKKTPEQVSQYWVDKLVRGEGQPPTQVPRVELMAKVVASLPGAIGYVTPDKVDAKLIVVARIRGGKVVAP